MNVHQEDGVLPPISPGEILKEQFMAPLGICAGTALRLAECFRTSPRFWLNLQMEYDLRRLQQTDWPCIRKMERG